MRRERPIIAIDGPVGAGKSTVAHALADALGFSYLNTGAMYRAAAIAFREAGIGFDDAERDRKIAPLLERMKIEFDGNRVKLNGREVTPMITLSEVSDLASRFSTLPAVRERMRELQRAMGARGGVVMEGRDIGTAVFPDAEFKFYLDADRRVRAERRYAELVAKGVTTDREEVLRQLVERDQRDSAREHAPLRRADGAIVIDTTNMTIGDVVKSLKERIEGTSGAERT